VWDTKRLWIVQADPVESDAGKAPGEYWIPPRSRDVNSERLKNWVSASTLFASDSPVRWRKIESLREFHAAKLPVPNVWVLSDPLVIAELAREGSVAGLTEDLRELCAGYLVTRVDVTARYEGLMLPKTDSTNRPTQVLEFLRTASRDLQAKGVAAEDICFIAHRYLRARASAWSFSAPGSPLVTIDSCWGLADGMSWLPHDRFIVDVDGSSVQRSIVGKPSLYDALSDRSWGYRYTPSEWIWRSSMSERQISSVARGAARLAANAGEPVLTMWFIGLLDGADADYIPWFQNHEIPEEESSHIDLRPTAPRACIKDLDDLERFDQKFDPNGSESVILLMPSADLIRDRDFVAKVTDIAKKRGLVIELEGSPLCHPFYLFQRAGVPVSCKSIRESKPVAFGKLVRDAIPDLIASRGESVVSYRATGPEMGRLLKVKLLEEAMEVFRSSNQPGLMDELADLLEVVDALRVNAKLTLKDLENRRRQKRQTRGGFDEGRVLVATTIRSAASHTSDQLPIPGVDEVRHITNWQVQLDGNRVVISNVPPMSDETRRFAIETASGIRLAIEYVPEGIVVTVLQSSNDSMQPKLFEL
jgi:predicted house-cleaning noncanonical NTP pyrophosphatase (MazG superfamily)